MHFLSAHQIYLCKMVSARVLYVVVLPMSLRIYSFLLLICCTQVLLTESATRCCVPTNFRSNMDVTGGFLSNSGPNIVDVGALLKTICGLCVYKNNELKYLSYDPLKFQHDWLQVACLFAIVSNTNHFILSKIQRRLYDSTKTSQSSSQILIYILGFYILLSYESSVQFSVSHVKTFSLQNRVLLYFDYPTERSRTETRITLPGGGHLLHTEIADFAKVSSCSFQFDQVIPYFN